MTGVSRFGCRFALVGSLVAACLVSLVGAASAQVDPEAAKCRFLLHGAAGKYLKQVLRAQGDCFKQQMRSNLAPSAVLDCADPWSWGLANESGWRKLEKRTAKVFPPKLDICARGVAGGPAVLDFDHCPAPCDIAVPVVADFQGAADCLACVAANCAESVMRDAFGTPPSLSRDERVALQCQLAIGKQLQTYAQQRNKLEGKCQKQKDRQARGYETIDCSQLEDPSHPLHSRYLKAYAKFAATVDKLCGGTTALESTLEGCGSDVASTQSCVAASVNRCVDLLHNALLGLDPTPTPSATATATASASPTVMRVSPSPTTSVTPSSTIPPASPTPGANAAACGSDADCGSGVCSADGVCCDRACDGVCEACVAAKTGGATGVCLPIVAATDPDGECGSANECSAGSCDGAGACSVAPLPAGTACGGPVSECGVQDTCDGNGVCVDNGYRSAGTACGSATDDACTDPDTCDGNGQCLPNDANLGEPCANGSECVAAGICDGSGSCSGNSFEPAGTPCGDPSATSCDAPDTCDGSGACLANPKPAGTACGDPGSACVLQDSCDGAGTCTDPGFASAGTVCADDGNPCTNDVCDAGGACVHPNNDAPCNDGVFCNGADTCSAGACSLHEGDPCSGPDGDADCSETCDEATASCSAPDPADSSCDDGLFCNGTETCNATGQCVPVGDVPCPSGGAYGGDDDGDCRESCNELTNTCDAADPDGTRCDDQLFCTGGDAGNSCVDGSECSTGICEAVCSGPQAGKPCIADGDCPGGACDAHACAEPQFAVDGATITLAQDRCYAGVCRGGAPPCPGDTVDAFGRGVGLSASCGDACDEASQTCTATSADGIDCSDDNFCNGNADTCQAGACVRSGDPCAGFPGDGDSDCSEACEETTSCSGFGCIGVGSCTAPDAADLSCDDGLFCTTTDTCDGSGGCTGTGDPCAEVGDGDANCAEACNEASDNCTAPDPAGLSCAGNGADECSGADTCDGAGACRNNDFSAGTSCGDTSTTECSNPDTCNGSGVCLSNHVTPGTNCGVAGSECKVQDTCNANGVCVDRGFEETGTACGSSSDSECDDPDTCNGAGACLPNFTVAGTQCADGNTADCNDAQCNGSGACDQGFALEPINTTCDDGQFCTQTDKCNAAGVCSGSGDPCASRVGDLDADCSESCNEASDSCTAVDPNGSTCSDGLFCNGADTCQAGSCSQHTGDPCSGPDGDGNCSESCNESNDSCTLPDPNGSACNDGLYCNGSDTCQGGACSSHAGDPCASRVGDDDSDCSESCNEGSDSCTANDPAGSQCLDNTLPGSGTANECIDAQCNGSGTCVQTFGNEPAGTTCLDTDLPGSGGGNECRAARCNGSGACAQGFANEPANTPCLDTSLPGSGGANQCKVAQCNTSGVCNQGRGNEPSGTSCQDGLFCTDGDSCNGSGACVGGSGDPCAGRPGDGDSDCSESCNEAADSCTANDPDNSSCDDGQWCNGADTCSAGTCSQHDYDTAVRTRCGVQSCGSVGSSCRLCNELEDSCLAGATVQSNPFSGGKLCGTGTFPSGIFRGCP